MGGRTTTAVSTLAALAFAAGTSVAIGQRTSERRISGQISDLFAASSGVDRAIVTEVDLVRLPEPVQRWLRWSHVVGNPIPSFVRLRQTGTFRLAEGKEWMPFTAEQYYTTNPPGFLWSVSMKMMSVLPIIGHDRYSGGVGAIDMRLLGLLPVAQKAGGALNQGALLRYLNEMMWFPAFALRPYISWTPIDSGSARATMTDGGTIVEATFFFDEEGRITTMTADRENDARGMKLPWSTPITSYGEFGDIRIPVEGTGIWQYETGDFAYIRLRITAIDYDQPARF